MKSLDSILKWFIIISSLIFIGIFIYVTISRIAYPFELEWMEGGSVEHLERLMKGEQIYTPPSLEYIPYIYTPLYYYAAVPIAAITGIGLLPLRIVSLASTLLIFFIIYLFVKRETESNYYGMVAAGLFSATFSLGGAWFDLARVDMLFILFAIACIYIIRFHHSPLYLVIAGLLAGCSFLTKQTALVMLAPMGLYLLIFERKNSLYFVLVFAFIVIGSTIYYSMSTDGWYYFWNFTLPADHRWLPKFFVLFWTYDLIKPLGIVILFSLGMYYFLFRENRKLFYFFAAILLGAAMTSWLSRLHYGGHTNVLLPIYLLLTMFGVIGFWQVRQKVKGELTIVGNSLHILIFVSIAILFQFITLIYSPRHQIPTKEEEKAGYELVEKIKSTEGDVFIPGNIYFARLAGKKTYTHGLLIWDLMQSSTRYGKEIKVELDDALKNHKFNLVVDYTQMRYPELNNYYNFAGNVFSGDELFWMRAGFTTRPERYFLPKK